MGDGGTRPQRGLLWGNPPPTRAIVGEPAPNAGYKGLLWAIVKVIKILRLT